MDALVNVLSTQVDRSEAKKAFDTKAVHETASRALEPSFEEKRA